jgi:hypothetical protein
MAWVLFYIVIDVVYHRVDRPVQVGPTAWPLLGKRSILLNHTLFRWHAHYVETDMYFLNCKFEVFSAVNRPITVAERSEAWTVFARSNTAILSSNPTRGMDVFGRLFCIYVVLCADSGLATGWSPSKESYRLCKKIKELEKLLRPNKGL